MVIVLLGNDCSGLYFGLINRTSPGHPSNQGIIIISYVLRCLESL